MGTSRRQITGIAGVGLMVESGLAATLLENTAGMDPAIRGTCTLALWEKRVDCTERRRQTDLPQITVDAWAAVSTTLVPCSNGEIVMTRN